MLDKKLLKAALLEQQQHVVEDFTTLLKNYQAALDIDEDTTIDLEDRSHQENATEMMHNTEVLLAQAQLELQKLDVLSTAEMNEVVPGAIVETNYGTFYISIPSHGFTYQGKEVIGIPTDAPIYGIMRGKKKGESYAFGKREYTIKEVY